MIEKSNVRINYRGFNPVGHLFTSGYNGQTTEYQVSASDTPAVFAGSVVELDGFDINGRAKVKTLVDGIPVGVVTGVKVDVSLNGDGEAFPFGSKGYPGFIPANTGGSVRVVDDPFVVFEAQAGKQTPAATAAAAGITTARLTSGRFYDVLHVVGDAKTGYAGDLIDANSGAAAAINYTGADAAAVNGTRKDIVLLGVVERIANQALGTAATDFEKVTAVPNGVAAHSRHFGVWRVAFANHAYK